MKFLLDANIPYSTKVVFGTSDSVLHVRDIGLSHTSDEEILARARKEKAVLSSCP